MRSVRPPARRGTVIPTLGVCLVALFGFVALAVDLGLLAVARTQCQNAADAAALVGCRNLNNAKPNDSTYDGNRPAAIAAARAVVPANYLLSSNFTAAQVASVTAGVYGYDTVAQKFSVTYPGSPPAGQTWTAMEVVVGVSQPTYFMRVFGVTAMPNGARAVAVHRPRDVAFVLDMTGSMAYASTTNYSGKSLNPDPLVPAFGHYPATLSNLIATANEASGTGEAISRNNVTITTPGGPPLVRDFRFDPANVGNPANPAYPVTSNTAALLNAFHRWSPSESGGDPTSYTAPTYDFSGYNAYHTGAESNPMGPTPAPDTFGTMTDSALNAYVGDRWRRKDGSINKTDTTWGAGSGNNVPGKQPATTALDLLGYTVSAGTVQTAGGVPEAQFRDAVWEANGYDLDIVQYRQARDAAGGPLNPATYSAPLVPSADRFKGFSMGPGYWGKTFYVWPPDPRQPLGNPGDANYQPGDWRRRYFLTAAGAAFDPQADNNPATTGTGKYDSVNRILINTTDGLTLAAITDTSKPAWNVNYTAVLKWIKSGPLVLPPNLRAGRVLYYSSIPDDVDTTTGTAQQQLDKVFWKNYIDYVLGAGSPGYYSSFFDPNAPPSSPYLYTALYGFADNWAIAPRTIGTSDLAAWTGPDGSWPSARPYMRYSDSPNRPRLHLWFGPLSMMDFIWAGLIVNWEPQNMLPGNCHESQCWQLKVGMNSVLDDIQKNHPNDTVGQVMYSYSRDLFTPAYPNVRVPLGQDFTALKNALFYPKSLLTAIRAGDTTSEVRPYTSSFGQVALDELPHAFGSTDPNTGLMLAFNTLSPSASLPLQSGAIRGRRGASKVVIFETDGVPNSYSNGTLNMKGYDTYYASVTGGSAGYDGDSTSMTNAVNVVKQIVKPMAGNNNGGTDSGLGLPNAPAKVYPIGFGDLFDPAASPSATFRPTAQQFLANVGVAGNTLPAGSTTIPGTQQITGSYQNRITNLKTCLQTIFQSGVAVTLVE